RQPYSQVALTSGLIDSPGERDVIQSHAHVRVMNSFVVSLASRLRAQYQPAEVSVDIAVTQQTLLVHQRRGHDPAMLHDVPIIRHDFPALLDHGKLTFVTG